jgi:hypothetical protein
MSNTLYALLAVMPLVAWFLYSQMYNWRFKMFNHVPQYFESSLVLGHLKSLAAGFKRLGDSRRHPGTFSFSHSASELLLTLTSRLHVKSIVDGRWPA